MNRAERAALYIFLFGVGATITAVAGPLAFPDLSKSVWRTALIPGIIVMVLSSTFLLYEYRTLSEAGRKMVPIFGLIVFGCGFIYCSYLLLRPPSSETPNAAGGEDERLPDVQLRFAQPKAPAVIIDNQSNFLAQNIKWTVLLWNIDEPRMFSGLDFPDGHEPLQIPISVFDFLRPHTSSGPQGIIGSNLLPFVHKGQTLIGCASIICPNCKRGYTYLLYLKFGENGWYAEDRGFNDGQLRIPTPMTKEGVRAYANLLLQEASNLKKLPFE